MWAYNNRLTSLPALPSGLKELIVSGNRLTSLPVLPS
ncbi:E3 ubiquitin-protein ligase SspH2, partial [Salmonella enterica subsp. enterica serovar Heidelberg str. N653]